MPIKYPMAVITKPHTVEFQEKTLRKLESEEILIKTHSAAICGSDLHLYKGLHPSVELPSAVGHEASGEVIETGNAVKKIKDGDRVTIEPVIACGKCDQCKRGNYNLCENISFQYRKGQGAFSPYFIAHQDHVFKLPDQISYEEGVLIEPLSVAMHAVKKSNIRLGQTSAIFGAGAIGIFVSMLSKQASGVGSYICDIHSFRLQKALDLGASLAINSLEQNPVEVILDATANTGVDRSYEAVGLEVTLKQALNVLKLGGITTMLGIFENPKVQLPINIFVQKEISLYGSQGYAWDFDNSIKLLANKSINVKPLITHTVSLVDLKKGFDILLDRNIDSLKVIVQMN